MTIEARTMTRKSGVAPIESRQQNRLLKAGSLQDAIINSKNFSSIATDERGVIQLFNVGAERMLGYSAAEMVNKITPADISDPQELVARAAALSIELDTSIAPGFEALVYKASRGIEDIYELTYIRKDGSHLSATVSVTALRDSQERIIGYLLIGTDNTARKEVEAAQKVLDQGLRDQQFYTRSLIESNIDAIMTTDLQGIITDVNQQMITLTGRSRDELLGAPCKDFFTDPARANAAIQRVLTENKVSNYELTVRSQDGTETVVSYNAATFHNRNRELQGVFAAARDVTELKKFERILQEKNLELEHASRMKSEFLATMSHELRTPLNAIIGFSEALKDGLVGETSEAQHGFIGDIFSSGQHLLSLINDILDLSKVEAGMMELELEAVDLKSLLSNSLIIVREKASAQKIQLELDLEEGLGTSLLDMRKVKQIVYNLLSNAVKFSPREGRVTLRARRVARENVSKIPGAWPMHGFPLVDNEHAEFFEIAVVDGGIGLAKGDMEKLFQAFSQIDSSLARKFEGTGLGLAMVKQLAELHGGSVAVSGAEGEGTCLAVWLPVRGATLPAPAPQGVAPAAVSKLPEASGMERFALVIEDDPHSAELIRVLLEVEGFCAVVAASAEEGLELVSRMTFSLITVDLQLPGMSGWEFLEKLREDKALTRIPVVVISGLETANLGISRGASAVLLKPISRAQLHTSIASLGLDAAGNHACSVLVVDDDPKAVEVIAAFLPSPAYSVARAFGGKEAIARAKELVPDLLLLDLMMPEVNGFDVVSALKDDPRTAAIPIIVVTAKQITAQDRAELSTSEGEAIPIVEKAAFNRIAFITEVRRALLPHQGGPSGENSDH